MLFMVAHDDSPNERLQNPDSDRSKWLTYEQLADLYKSLAQKYPIVSIEDPFAEDDWDAWSYFFKTSDFQIVG